MAVDQFSRLPTKDLTQGPTMRSTIPSRFASSDSPVDLPTTVLSPTNHASRGCTKTSVPFVKEGHQRVPEGWWRNAMQYEKQDEHDPPIEVILGSESNAKLMCSYRSAGNSTIQCSKGVHAIVARKNILDLAVRLRGKTSRLATPAGTIRFNSAT